MPGRRLLATLGCMLRGHSPDPRSIADQDDGTYQAECYFCRRDLVIGPLA